MTETPSRKGEAGFTYIAVLMMVVIMGIMLGMAGTSWKTVMKREREAELIFRGTQIRNAIAARWGTAGQGNIRTPLNDLKDLLLDPRSLQKKRYLRRLYKDPITGEKWKELKDPVRGIYGVASTSNEEPLKQANFPEDLKQLNGKKKYSEWEFVVP